jgi:hypothetical protein
MIQLHKLISITDIQTFRAISDNIPEDRIDPYILEAQQFDLKGILGKDLYNKLFEVVSPGVYEYASLKPEYLGFLAYSTYARFLGQNQVTSTSHGVVMKKTDWSENLTDQMLTRVISQARSNASAYGIELIQFLNDNVSSYPEWKSCNQYKPKTGNFAGAPRIGAVKGRPSQWQV